LTEVKQLSQLAEPNLVVGVLYVCRLEQCLKEVVDYEQQLSGGAYPCCENAADALRRIFDSQLMHTETCSDVNMDCLQHMLKQMVSTLH